MQCDGSALVHRLGILLPALCSRLCKHHGSTARVDQKEWYVLAFLRFGPDAEFTLETDANGVGLGAILSQKQQDDQLHPIAYASCALDPSERNYAITELETLAVVWTAQKFCPYLLGQHTFVFMDHSTCMSVLNSARPSGKLARWALTIQELNLTLKHCAQKLNINVDALSYNPMGITCEVDFTNHSGIDTCLYVLMHCLMYQFLQMISVTCLV